MGQWEWWYSDSGASAHPEGGVAEIKAISFGDYGAKLLEGVLTWGWGCVRVPIESP